MLPASPEYFRPDCPDRAGHFEVEKLDVWVDANLRWLQRKHGDNLIKATVHLDEATPHIVAYVVPIHDDPRWPGQKKLSYNIDFGGSKYWLSELQDEYADDMKPLGLERGIKGSKAEHQAIQDYYAEANAALEQIQQREAERQAREQAAINLANAADQQAVEAERKMQLAQRSQQMAAAQQADLGRRIAELQEEAAALDAKRREMDEQARCVQQHLEREFSRLAILAWQQQQIKGAPVRNIVRVGNLLVNVVLDESRLAVADLEKRVLLRKRGDKTEATPLLKQSHLEDLRQWRDDQVQANKEKLQIKGRA